MLHLTKIPPKKPENLAIRSNPVSASAHRWLGARASLLTGCLRDTLRPRACICILQFCICICTVGCKTRVSNVTLPQRQNHEMPQSWHLGAKYKYKREN